MLVTVAPEKPATNPVCTSSSTGPVSTGRRDTYICEGESGMNKDRVKGKVKDVAGRMERQAGEWTGDSKKQAEGAAKQVEGKLQNAWGRVKDATRKESDKAQPSAKPPQSVPDVTDSEEESQKISRRKGK